ncbi:L,D-transpeptidase family protein [Pseudoalteromonas sp. C2R02]|uniref:L,D-transpeptidase family protein n=1 Tax=Pseudoalteromonas sp. C2R02 TaxID=2841565 RepID=UPI001C0A4D1F|nr:L,D-transpeptidase family protein [Pseudoalteromonas sp. C2R02]MBU2968528.1 L,D-transpeptidase family protein [Pseudoalteromonas sp. C2R02]
MIQNSLFVIVFYYLCCSQVIASQDAPSLEKRLISSHSMPTSVIKLNNERALENNFEKIINKVNVERVNQRIYFLKRLAKLKVWPYIKFETFLNLGDRHPMISEVKHRLYLLGYLKQDRSAKNTFSKVLFNALSQFQKHHGLNPDGIIGPRTLNWLNTSPAQRADLLLRNLHRQQDFFSQVEQEYLVINIPQFQLSVVNQGEGIFSSKVIVGKSKRPTPTLSSEIQSVVLNPSWNVPRKIVRRDLLPKIRRNSDYLDEENYDVFDFDGNKISLSEFNWSKLAKGRFPYKLRQRPGPTNALGQVKFHFNNEHSVYIHDTPDKALFDESRRDFSSGCIRVEKANELALWFKETRLANQDSWHKVIKNNEGNKWFKLKEPLAIHLVYWTAWVDEYNQVQYRSDIYDKENVLYKNKKPQLDLKRNQTIARIKP